MDESRSPEVPSSMHRVVEEDQNVLLSRSEKWHNYRYLHFYMSSLEIFKLEGGNFISNFVDQHFLFFSFF